LNHPSCTLSKTTQKTSYSLPWIGGCFGREQLDVGAAAKAIAFTIPLLICVVQIVSVFISAVAAIGGALAVFSFEFIKF
jgi:hypothetical protein